TQRFHETRLWKHSRKMAKTQAFEIEAHQSGQSNRPMTRPAHALPPDAVVEEADANAEDGLTTAEAKNRLERFGENELGDEGGVQPVKILIRQVCNAMTLVSFSGTPYDTKSHRMDRF